METIEKANELAESIKKEIDEPKERECMGRCPNCLSEDIEWCRSDLDLDGYHMGYHGECKKCGCDFKEWYVLEYTGTTY